MFLLMVIIILIAATSILSNIYVGIFPFQQNYGDLENYSNSQYAAISAIERGLLVTKYKKPSFVGSGGFVGTGNWGEVSDFISEAFGKLNTGDNGFYWEINSKCEMGSGTLDPHNVIVISTYTYNNTSGYYENDGNAITTKGISDAGVINGSFENIEDINNLTNGDISRQINGDNEISGYTGFVSSSGTTNIKIGEINNVKYLTFKANTINPSATPITGDILCTQSGCYHADISDLIQPSKNDKGIILYIQNRLLKDNNQIGSVKYYLENNFNGNCQNYTITGIAIVGKYKQTISIKKPTFNYKNPNRKDFIFPYYK